LGRLFELKHFSIVFIFVFIPERNKRMKDNPVAMGYTAKSRRMLQRLFSYLDSIDMEEILL